MLPLPSSDRISGVVSGFPWVPFGSVSSASWNADGIHEASDAANVFESRRHKPTRSITADPWLQEAQELQQRLAQLLSGVKSPSARFSVTGTGKSQKE
jgi:hypothetical protein